MTKSTKKTSTPKPRNIPGISFLRDRYIGFLAAVFFITRIGCWLAGVRFDAYVNVHLMHFVPSALLREHLWASVIHLHNQPPLFNLFLGIVYTLFPGSSSVVFHTIYLVLGLTLTLSLYSIMTRLGVMKKLAAALTVLFIASPACILYENLLLYCYPVTVMLCLGVLFLVRFLEKGCTLDLLCFFCLTAAVVLTRSMYHLVWFAAFPVLLIVFRRNEWKRILAAALIPFMAVFLLYAKNLYLFGGFNGSSWMGMSLSKLATMRVPEKDRIELMRRGKLSELSLIPPFKALWQYGEYGDIPEFKATGVQVLDTVFYPGEGQTNVPLAFPGHESPDPFPNAQYPVGYAVTLFTSLYAGEMQVKSYSLKPVGGLNLSLLTFMPSSESGYPFVFAMAAKDPLLPGTEYEAHIEAIVSGQTITKTWRFTTTLKSTAKTTVRQLPTDSYDWGLRSVIESFINGNLPIVPADRLFFPKPIFEFPRVRDDR